jgi:hypothetical protein
MVTEVVALLAMLTPLQADSQKSSVDNGVSWLRSAWTRVQTEGRPAAERTLRQYPDRFKDVPKRVSELTSYAMKLNATMTTEEKKALLLELWRIRQSLNLMSLVEPVMLEHLTGIKAEEFRSVQAQFEKVRSHTAKLVVSTR